MLCTNLEVLVCTNACVEGSGNSQTVLNFAQLADIIHLVHEKYVSFEHYKARTLCLS